MQGYVWAFSIIRGSCQTGIRMINGDLMPGKPWCGWYHCMGNTYGTWLPGDPRGFRTRGHREHVEGDYKRPPAVGIYEQRHTVAKGRMTRAAVVLRVEARGVVVGALVHALVEVHGIEVLAVSVSAMHMHVLARFSLGKKPTFSKRGLRSERTSAVDDQVRHLMGIAKKESAKRLVSEGLAKPGGVWARKGKIVPIRDRGHQVNVYKYILDHACKEGAAVWSFRDGIDDQV